MKLIQSRKKVSQKPWITTEILKSVKIKLESIEHS